MKLLLVMEIDLGLCMYIMAKGLSLIAPSKPGKCLSEMYSKFHSQEIGGSGRRGSVMTKRSSK